MPNHVINKVTIMGDKSEIAKCKKQIINAYKSKDGETKTFSFETIVPMPESLHIESSTIVDDAIAYIKSECDTIPVGWLGIGKDEIDRRVELGRVAMSNIEKYGYKDWYDWSIANWGTKWDAYEVSEYDTDSSIHIEFWSAWSTPVPVFKKLASQYPALEIEVMYADEDLGCNCGTYRFLNGEMIDWSDRGYVFACELWGYEPDELSDELS